MTDIVRKDVMQRLESGDYSCAKQFTLAMISGKWKMKLLYLIGYEEVIRYGQLKRNADPISHKVLSSQLKELEEDGLILRTEYPSIPLKVEYSLTKKGLGLLPMFDALYEWIVTYEIEDEND